MAFRGKIQCPVDASTRQWIDQRWAWLMREFGCEGFRKRPLILPDPKFFPDSYTGTFEDVEALLFRVACYMEIDPERIELKFYQETRLTDVGEHHGTAGLYHEENGRFQIWLETRKLANPAALIATMAHELGHVHLLGHGRVSHDEEDHEPLTDLITVFFGMGVITANSVIHEDYWQAGHFTGWSMGRHGYLTMAMYGYAFALYARDRDEENPTWTRELRLDVRSAFKQATRYLKQDEFLRADEEVPAKPQGLVLAGKEEPSEPREEGQADDGRAYCTYCGAEVEPIEAENAESEIGSKLGVCAECQESMAESDAEPYEEPKLMRKVQNLHRWVVVTLLVLLGISALLVFLGRLF
jgi:hypothetical protein